MWVGSQRVWGTQAVRRLFSRTEQINDLVSVQGSEPTFAMWFLFQDLVREVTCIRVNRFDWYVDVDASTNLQHISWIPILLPYCMYIFAICAKSIAVSVLELKFLANSPLLLSVNLAILSHPLNPNCLKDNLKLAREYIQLCGTHNVL